MKQIFDFDLIRNFIKSNPKFTLLFDGMHGVTGPYGKRVFVEELGLPADSVMNCIPLPDFGGGHPDPNLSYAKDLVEMVKRKKIDFGAASDGDGDRNMIIAHDAFVNPSDSVASIDTISSLVFDMCVSHCRSF
jgi:phosphoglucomutase